MSIAIWELMLDSDMSLWYDGAGIAVGNTRGFRVTSTAGVSV